MSTTLQFDHTGSATLWIVPEGVTELTNVICIGGWGGARAGSGTIGGEPGIVVIDSLPVVPGLALWISPGGKGGNGSGVNGGLGGTGVVGTAGGPGGKASGTGAGGGGGGGASVIYGISFNLTTRHITRKYYAVAAGGGGNANGRVGGDGGNPGLAGDPGGTQGGGGATVTTNGIGHPPGTTAGIDIDTEEPWSSYIGGKGGSAATTNQSGGGGGGAGYKSGGGGVAGIPPGDGAGGGGANYVDPSAIGVTNDTGSDPSTYYGRIFFTYNATPDAPSLIAPANGEYIGQDKDYTFRWTFSDPDPDDSQSRADIQYRVGAGGWTQVNNIASTESFFVSPAGTWLSYYGLTVEWQIRVYDQDGSVSAWSASSFFTVSNTPLTPVITTPLDGASVTNSEALAWTDTSHKAYRYRRVADNAGVANPAIVYFDSGIVLDPSNVTHGLFVNFPVNSRDEHLQVAYQDPVTSLWSDYGDALVHVAWLAAPSPVVTLTPFWDQGNVLIGITNPASTGSEPDTLGNNIYIVLKEGDTPIKIVDNHPPNTSYMFETPVDGMFIYVTAVGDNGTESQFLLTEPLQIGLRGVWLCDPLDPENTKVNFQYNGHGASETYDVESTVTHYAGRSLPVTDFGDAVNNTLTVDINTIDGDGTDNALRNFVIARKLLLYRDHKGRRAFGTVSSHPREDRFGREVTQLVFIINEFNEESLL